MWKDVVKAKKYRYASTYFRDKAVKGATKIMKEKYDDFNDKTKYTKYSDEYVFYMRLIRNGMPIYRAARQTHESKIQYDDKGNFTIKE
tara:strand:+ start:43 stop:306 length:264 start_codon:yes stop_codon:yes gene_type:complete